MDPRLVMQLHSSHRAHPLRRIFSPAALRAIISWGFKHGSKQLRDHPERVRVYMLGGETGSSKLEVQGEKKEVDNLRWPSHITPPSPLTTYLRGISLIEALVQMGVNVETAVVRRAVVLCLWQLFSPGHSAVKSNVQAKAVNPYSLEQILDCLLDRWRGPPLFPELLLNPEDVLKQPKQLGRNRRATEKIQVHTILRASESKLHIGAEDLNTGKADTLPYLPLVSAATVPVRASRHLPERSSKAETLGTPQQRLIHPRYPTVLDGLVPERIDSLNSTPLSKQEIVSRRTQLAYAVFGKAPSIGGEQSVHGQKIDPTLWARAVDAWARRPLGSKAPIFEGVRWSWKGAVPSSAQHRRRSPFHVEKSRAR
jgi:hypothetical protein